jgi:3-deoxy-D-manno-octulosonic-acid transferase
VQLGADARHVTITGSIKFDRVETDRQNPATSALRKAFGLSAHDRVLIAGSTQSPEETYALQTYQALRTKHPRLRLILVPRHRERFEEVACLVRQRFGLPLLRRTEVLQSAEAGRGAGAATSGTTGPAVLLLDTLGELSACWGLGDLAFVGGSLTPRGGQNMMEPAGYGAAVMFGPNTQNFKETVELLLGQQAAVVVRSPAELTTQVERFLEAPELAEAYGARARELVQTQRGATSQTVQLIAEALGERQPSRQVGQAA